MTSDGMPIELEKMKKHFASHHTSNTGGQDS